MALRDDKGTDPSLMLAQALPRIALHLSLDALLLGLAELVLPGGSISSSHISFHRRKCLNISVWLAQSLASLALQGR